MGTEMSTRDLVKSEWQVFVLALIVLISAVLLAAGYVASRSREVLALELALENQETLRSSRTVLLENQKHLTDLRTKSNSRPLAFDACAGKELTEAVRATGVKIPKMEYELRCEAERIK